MWRTITWILLSSGAVRCRGAPCGRGRHRIVWTIYVWHMLCQQLWKRRIWVGGSHHGQTWTDALKPSNSEISTDVLLFSELGHALVHHYWVFQKGTSHVSLREDYLTRLRTFVTQSAGLSRWGQRDVPGHYLPLRTVCVPRETSGGETWMRNLPANSVVLLAGCALHV